MRCRIYHVYQDTFAWNLYSRVNVKHSWGKTMKLTSFCGGTEKGHRLFCLLPHILTFLTTHSVLILADKTFEKYFLVNLHPYLLHIDLKVIHNEMNMSLIQLFLFPRVRGVVVKVGSCWPQVCHNCDLLKVTFSLWQTVVYAQNSNSMKSFLEWRPDVGLYWMRI